MVEVLSCKVGDAIFTTISPLELHVGIDDTDSKLGGCTTYTTALIFEELHKRGFTPIDFPWLVRLNPNIPWKTRGNGALALHFLLEDSRLNEAKAIVLAKVAEITDVSLPSTDPAVAFLTGKIPRELAEFSETALHDVVRVRDAKTLARKVKADPRFLKGSRGLVGALAAVGADLQKNHTFEIIAYRTRKTIGTPRNVDQDSVREMDARFGGSTFNNLDPETGRILISPHGPDPVLLGIRGEDPEILVQAFRSVKVDEPIERVMVFKTNHGTDAHFTIRRTVAELRPYQSAVVLGKVEERPRVLTGGHVVFTMSDGTGLVDCAAYAPTGSFRKIVLKLLPGDRVVAFGGIRRRPGKGLTMNLEKLEIVKLVEAFRYEKPRCSRCSRGSESMGRGQGFRCRKCGLRFPRESLKTVLQHRAIRETVYIPPPRANRHLTKPASRYGRERISTELHAFPNSQVDSLESLLRTVQPALPSQRGGVARFNPQGS